MVRQSLDVQGLAGLMLVLLSVSMSPVMGEPSTRKRWSLLKLGSDRRFRLGMMPLGT